MKRNLLLPIIFSQAINAQAWTANSKIDESLDKANSEISSINQKLQDLCGDGRAFSLENAKADSNRLWKEIVNQVNNARIKFGIDESAMLTDRSSISLGKETISEATSNGKYLGIDKWRLSVGASLLNTEAADLGISGTREVTFIQQFPSRCKSIVRLGYDPVTKLPITAERALTRLQPGDFVAFSSPLTLSLGKSFTQFFENTELTKTLGGFSLYATGEFNIHVYRMENNHVRVRFFAAKTKGASVNPGLKFYMLSGLLNLKLIEGELGRSLTNLFSADYVFNLNNEESRQMYDKVMGEKFELKKIINMAADTINPFASDTSVMKKLLSDLTQIHDASIADSGKKLEDRRVIRLSEGKTETNATHRGIGLNVLIAKLRHRTTYADSLVSFFDVMNESQKYIIKTISVLKQSVWFETWGQEDTHNSAMLVKTDERYNPTQSAGLQNIRVKEELLFSKNELRGLRNRLQRLPAPIKATLNLPDPDKLAGDISRARIEQSIFLDTQALESQESITYKSVKDELKKLIQNWGDIDSDPYGLNMNSGSDDLIADPRLNAYSYANYYLKKSDPVSIAKGKELLLEAYAHELELIPNYLSGLFGKENIKNKLEYYNKLQNIPLFNELGITLVLNLIAQADANGTSPIKMKDAVSYRLAITGRGIEPKISEYPAIEKNADGNLAISENLKKSEIFQRILNDNAYMTDRSFNLRYYMNDKGESLSLQEVVERSKGR